MALTPEDVLNKTFGTTQFRRGYDEREVDDFLDEVVATMRRLTTDLDNCRKGLPVQDDAAEAELADLRTRLERESALRAEAERALEQSQSAAAGPGSPDGFDATSVQDAENQAQARIDAANARAEEAEAAAQARVEAIQAELQAREAHAETVPADAASSPTEAGEPAADASGLIALAQRVHDEHVAEGESTRDRLIAEAQERHDSLLEEASSQRDSMIQQAQEHAGNLVAEAEAQRDRVLGDLSGQRDALQERIAQLRGFEGDYRGHLRDYLSGRLSDLDALPPVGQVPDASDRS